MKIKSWELVGFSQTILGHMAWAFIGPGLEAQKGAEDMGQIKALVGGLPMTQENKISQTSCNMHVLVM